MAWIDPDAPNAVSPAWKLLIDWGVLDRTHELTAMRWCKLQWSPFDPLGGHPVLYPIYRAAMGRLTKWERSLLGDLTGALDPEKLREDYASDGMPGQLNAACEKLAAILLSIEAVPAGETSGEPRPIFEWLLHWGTLPQAHEAALRAWAALPSAERQAMFHGTPSRFLRRPANLTTLLMNVQGYRIRIWSEDKRTMAEIDGDCLNLAERLASRSSG